MAETTQDLQDIYRRRFSGTQAYRNRVWLVLTSSFFSRWIAPMDAVLDLGCGYGEFINNIRAGQKWAMDLNPEAPRHIGKDVRFLHQDCSAAWPLPEASLDAVFTSNFLEHLPDQDSLKRALRQAHRCLKPGGRFIAMGPNIKYLPGRYWDFFDHHLALTERSLAEGLEMVGFKIERAIPRFLPYTLVGAPRYPLFLVRLYVLLPWLWWSIGKQFLVVGTKSV